MERVLIVGAGIAGDALAVLLARRGWDVTVAEIAPGLRSGGQIVDLRNGSDDVLARMGLLGALDGVLIEQSGMAWVDADGRHRAEMPVSAFGGRGFVSEKELARTDLAAVVHSAAGGVRYLWSETVVELADTPQGVAVTLRGGGREVYDVVVGADGVHSGIRALRFGDEARYRRPLGVAHAWFTLHETGETADLDGWFELHNAPRSRVVGVRPGHPGSQEVGFSMPSDGLPPDRRDRAARVGHLERCFADVGWRAQEFLAAARHAEDLAIDTGDQIRMSGWHDGRVVLLGDSAWCAAPLSGLGTALALQGAESLARRLEEHRGDRDPGGAFARWETDMRPAVTRAQRLPPGRVRSFAPRTARGIRIMTAAMRALQSSAAQRVAATAMRTAHA